MLVFHKLWLEYSSMAFGLVWNRAEFGVRLLTPACHLLPPLIDSGCLGPCYNMAFYITFHLGTFNRRYWELNLGLSGCQTCALPLSCGPFPMWSEYPLQVLSWAQNSSVPTKHQDQREDQICVPWTWWLLRVSSNHTLGGAIKIPQMGIPID